MNANEIPHFIFYKTAYHNLYIVVEQLYLLQCFLGIILKTARLAYVINLLSVKDV